MLDELYSLDLIPFHRSDNTHTLTSHTSHTSPSSSALQPTTVIIGKWAGTSRTERMGGSELKKEMRKERKRERKGKKERGRGGGEKERERKKRGSF